MVALLNFICFMFYLIFFVRMVSEANASSANSKEIPKFGKDSVWEHGEKVSVRVRYKFCDHKVNGGIRCNTWHKKHEIVYLAQKSLMI